MAISSGLEVSQLREEADASRARLSDTVDELRTHVSDTVTGIKDKLSPAALKAEVSEYVRGSTDQILQRAQAAAMENPVRAAALGAAIAYPVFNIVKAMPAPLLLIGAGLFLSGSKGRKLTDAAAVLRAKSNAALQTAAERAEELRSSARRGLHDTRDVVSEQGSTVVQQAKQGLAQTKDQVMDAAYQAGTVVSDMTETIADTASDLTWQARTKAAEVWEQNPLVIAGVGLAFGAFVAAAFPATRAEEKFLGDASGAVRKKAESLSSQMVYAANTVIESTLSAADEQGLSPNGLRDVGDELARKATAVAQKGIEAALVGNKPSDEIVEEERL